MSTIKLKTLPNGVRVLVEPLHYVQSAAVGLWCQTGSRHEHNDEGGITHFIEHMLFKGTPSRTSKQIAETIEGRGGSINAFTDKESTCYYCRVLAEDVPMSIDVLGDMMLHSKLSQPDLTLEKGVILEEISRSMDEPSDYVHDLHMQTRWGDHPLGRPIIGTRDSVASFEPENLRQYMNRRYRAENVVLAVAGDVKTEEVLEVAERFLGKIPSSAENGILEPPVSHIENVVLEKDVEGVHFCIGTDGISNHDDDEYALAVMEAALGGNMSSRLFQEIREKRGLAYAIGTYSLRYSVAGTFNIYGGTSPETWEQVRDLSLAELEKVRQNGLEPEELERVKHGLTGRVVLALESMSSRMMRMSRNEMIHGRQIPVEEVIEKIKAIKNNNIIELANRLFNPDRVASTVIGPVQAK